MMYICFVQDTGSLIQASKRFQINLELKPIKYPGLKKVPSMLLPVLWVDEVCDTYEHFKKSFFL
jgi:hypothetical protein